MDLTLGGERFSVTVSYNTHDKMNGNLHNPV